MFQFPRCPRADLCVQSAVTRYDAGRVAPFGDPRISLLGSSPRHFVALPRPSSARIAEASTARRRQLGPCPGPASSHHRAHIRPRGDAVRGGADALLCSCVVWRVLLPWLSLSLSPLSRHTLSRGSRVCVCLLCMSYGFVHLPLYVFALALDPLCTLYAGMQRGGAGDKEGRNMVDVHRLLVWCFPRAAKGSELHPHGCVHALSPRCRRVVAHSSVGKVPSAAPAERRRAAHKTGSGS